MTTEQVTNEQLARSIDDLARMTAEGFAHTATKAELAELRSELKGEMAEMKAELKAEIGEVKETLHNVDRRLGIVDEKIR